MKGKTQNKRSIRLFCIYENSKYAMRKKETSKHKICNLCVNMHITTELSDKILIFLPFTYTGQNSLQIWMEFLWFRRKQTFREILNLCLGVTKLTFCSNARVYTKITLHKNFYFFIVLFPCVQNWRFSLCCTVH